MSFKTKIGFWCYTLTSCLMAIMGLRYIFATEIMPYHLAALDTSWMDLSTVYQFLLLNFMRSVGIGFLTSAIATMILIWIPYREEQAWARWSITAIQLLMFCSLIAIVFSVRANTTGQPPVAPFMLGILLSLSGLVCSAGIRKNDEISLVSE